MTAAEYDDAFEKGLIEGTERGRRVGIADAIAALRVKGDYDGGYFLGRTLLPSADAPVLHECMCGLKYADACPRCGETTNEREPK